MSPQPSCPPSGETPETRFLILAARLLLEYNMRSELLKRHLLRAAQHLGLEVLVFVAYRGVIAGERVAPVAAPWPATQLAATEILCAPVGGVVVYQAQPGQQLLAGARIGYVLDPLTGESHVLPTRFGGMFFARVAGRLATQAAELAYIAGQGEVRRGQLLSA